MIRPFTLHDLRLLKQLQKRHGSLCPIETLTRPQSPLWTAFASLLPFAEGLSFTFVLQEQRGVRRQLQGFIQGKQPTARTGMYLQRLTPPLDGGEDAQAVWNRLVNYAVAAAGERGIQRIYACTENGSPEMAVLTGAGFSVYAREDLYRLAPDTHPQAAAPNGIRPQQSIDLWEVSQLYRAITPRLVQRAESLTEDASLEELCGPMGWGQGEGFVLEDRAGIAGYGYLTSGRAGHRLSIMVHPRAYDQVGELLDYSLALLNYYPPRPVYCTVREYQGGVRVPMEERGFERFAPLCRLVKHTTVRVQEPARGLVPALEKRVEAPTTTMSPTERSGS